MSYPVNSRFGGYQPMTPQPLMFGLFWNALAQGLCELLQGPRCFGPSFMGAELGAPFANPLADLHSQMLMSGSFVNPGFATRHAPETRLGQRTESLLQANAAWQDAMRSATPEERAYLDQLSAQIEDRIASLDARGMGHLAAHRELWMAEGVQDFHRRGLLGKGLARSSKSYTKAMHSHNEARADLMRHWGEPLPPELSGYGPRGQRPGHRDLGTPSFEQLPLDDYFRREAPARARQLDDPSRARLANDPGRARLLNDPGRARLLNDPGRARLLNDPGRARLLNDPGRARLLNDPGRARLLNDPGRARLLNDPGRARLLNDPGRARLLNDPGRASNLNEPGRAPATAGVVVPQPAWAPKAIDKHTLTALRGCFAADNRGRVAPDTKVIASPTGDGGQLREGDTVRIEKPGAEPTVITLSKEQAYDANFRGAMVRSCEELKKPWEFTTQMIEMPTGKTVDERPLSAEHPQRVLKRNDHWDLIEKLDQDGQTVRFLKIREKDDQGNPVSPSDAVNDIFNRPDAYKFDCATPMRLMNLKATMDVIGRKDFDAEFQGLPLYGQYDANDTSKNGQDDSGFVVSGQLVAPSQDVGIGANKAVANVEYTRFDPNNDRLRPGEVRYFERPGDIKSHVQGWNVIYLGTDEKGNPKFWRVRNGVETVPLKDNFDGQGGFDGEYLSSQRGTTDVDALIELHRSAR